MRLAPTCYVREILHLPHWNDQNAALDVADFGLHVTELDLKLDELLRLGHPRQLAGVVSCVCRRRK
ncbi:hypothetical protein [Pseudomonas glycinae]|uniref:Uncharacterized protein n=1 Tax=Pseudomonas glycinae TaxID=1785145 RepID=A0ABM6QI87_9PSED|nr:hypothetical protein [Pseudomonas glycinae]AUG97412.1 hypothetical protein AWU82_28425 [Pseudomonas glycinae]